MEVAEASRRDNNKRVEEARRARVLWLERLRRESSSEEEFQTARSQPTWTELDTTSCSSSCALDGPSSAELERVRHENRLHFQHLLDTQPPSIFSGDSYKEEHHPFGSVLFFVDCGGKLEVGEKIGGGGQAEIYRAIYDGKVSDSCVLKVFRNDYYLADLQRLWMKNIATTSMFLRDVIPFNRCCFAIHGTLLQDGRFAFIMRLCWGDLRKAIDLAILKDKTYQSPPFPIHTTWRLMFSIAKGMQSLHDVSILHRDLKGENCLLPTNLEDAPSLVWEACIVADFDSPEGVKGTRFWRAPKILLALKNRVRDLSSHPRVWTEKADVYSYAMTCYEILTSCIPFKDRTINNYDGVICGERPPLPDYVDLELGELVKMCWHSEPSMRPTFKEIIDKLQTIYSYRPEQYLDL